MELLASIIGIVKYNYEDYLCYLIGDDYSLPTASLSVSFTSSMAGEQFCIDISTIDDLTGEGTEQFELYFENLPSQSARDGDPNVLCVNILDNDGELIVAIIVHSATG